MLLLCIPRNVPRGPSVKVDLRIAAAQTRSFPSNKMISRASGFKRLSRHQNSPFSSSSRLLSDYDLVVIGGGIEYL